MAFYQEKNEKKMFFLCCLPGAKLKVRTPTVNMQHEPVVFWTRLVKTIQKLAWSQGEQPKGHSGLGYLGSLGWKNFMSLSQAEFAPSTMIGMWKYIM